MKKLILVWPLLFFAVIIYAQNQNTEAEIRSLEQMEVKAVLEKDTVTLLKLWDKDYVVNAPSNKVVFSGKSAVDRPVMTMSRSAFTREVEQIIIHGDVVFSMGGETVVPAANQPQSGQTIKRRYTNIWMKKEGKWKLVARHANVICQQN
jgi:ketosteroid isomerase-like protein